jgi:hypothetical protein
VQLQVLEEVLSHSLPNNPIPPASPPFNWEDALHADLPLLDTRGEMENTFNELLQMMIGESNENFTIVDEVDFQRMRDSGCKEFLENKDEGIYYDAQEEMFLEALFWGPQLLHTTVADSTGRPCKGVAIGGQGNGRLQMKGGRTCMGMGDGVVNGGRSFVFAGVTER